MLNYEGMKRPTDILSRVSRVSRVSVAVVSITLLIAGCSTGAGGESNDDTSSQELTKITVANNTRGLEFVAIEKGFFKDHGLEVKSISMPDISSIPALVGKQFDFGISTQNLVIAASAKGIDVVVTGGGNAETEEARNYGLVTLEKSGISKPSDLVGKTVGVPAPNGSIPLALKYWLKENNVQPDKVNLIQVSFANMKDQLEADRVDAVFEVSPFLEDLMSVPGTVNLGDPFLSVAPDQTTMGSITISDRAWAEANLDIVKRYQAAQMDAAKFIEENPEEANQITGKAAGLSADAIAKMTTLHYSAVTPLSDLENWLHAMQEISGFEGEVDLEGLIVQPLLDTDACFLPVWNIGNC